MAYGRLLGATGAVVRGSVRSIRVGISCRIPAVSAGDIAELLGYLVSAWAVGLAGGWACTVFKRAFDVL